MRRALADLPDRLAVLLTVHAPQFSPPQVETAGGGAANNKGNGKEQIPDESSGSGDLDKLTGAFAKMGGLVPQLGQLASQLQKIMRFMEGLNDLKELFGGKETGKSGSTAPPPAVGKPLEGEVMPGKEQSSWVKPAPPEAQDAEWEPVRKPVAQLPYRPADVPQPPKYPEIQAPEIPAPKSGQLPQVEVPEATPKKPYQTPTFGRMDDMEGAPAFADVKNRLRTPPQSPEEATAPPPAVATNKPYPSPPKQRSTGNDSGETASDSERAASAQRRTPRMWTPPVPPQPSKENVEQDRAAPRKSFGSGEEEDMPTSGATEKTDGLTDAIKALTEAVKSLDRKIGKSDGSQSQRPETPRANNPARPARGASGGAARPTASPKPQAVERSESTVKYGEQMGNVLGKVGPEVEEAAVLV